MGVGSEHLQYAFDEFTKGSSWNVRVVGLRSPWIFLDLEDDGSFQGRMHLSQLGGKERLISDEHGLKVETQNGLVVIERPTLQL